MTNRKKEELTHSTFKLLWFALFISANISMFLVFYIKPKDLVEANQFPMLLPAALAILISFAIPYMIAKYRKKPFKPSETLNLAFVPFLIKMAMFEAIAVLGMLEATNHAEASKFYPFYLVSIIGMLLYFPFQSTIRRLVKFGY